MAYRALTGIEVVGAVLMMLMPAGAQDRVPADAPRFRIVTVGQHFSCGLTTAGEAYCWGANYYGQIGASTAPGIEACAEGMDLSSTCALLPVRVNTSLRFADLSAGLKHVCGVADDRTVWCWGRNNAGQVSTGVSAHCSPRSSARGSEEYAPSPCSFEPVQVGMLPPARLVAGGDDFSCALSEEGEVFCWGGSAGAQPVRLSSPGSPRFMTIAAGYTDVCASTDDARVACWSLYGEVSGAEWPSVAEGVMRVAISSHTCAIGAETNRAYCWGFNAHGSLGKGTHSAHERVRSPTLVAGNRKFVQIATSFLGTCAVEAARGELFCWGSVPAAPHPDRCASGGEFGGSSPCALTPQPLFPRRNFSSVALAVAHGCAIAATDNAYCWGANEFGQLGNGTTDAATTLPHLVGVQGPASERSLLTPTARILAFAVLVGLLGVIAVRMLRFRRA